MKKVDVVIVNWNAGTLLEECVRSVIAFGMSEVGRLIIVDNNSNDNSTYFLSNIPEARLICAEENLGFGRACNLGAKYCRSEFILFLNPDARVYANTLKSVADFMCQKKNLDIGICGVQLENEFGKIARSNSRFPSVTRLLSHAIGLNRIFPSLGTPIKEWDHSSTRLVDQVIGAFFFVRRNLFKELNGFDERFFVYFEEVDFSFRAKRLGYSSIYICDTKAFHVGGGTTNQVKSARLFYSIRSRLYYCQKHFNAFGFAFVCLGTLLIEPVSRILFGVIKKSSESILETYKAYLMLYKWVFHVLRRKKTR